MLLAVVARTKADGAPLRVIDTHAGSGIYRLDDPSARRSGEAEAGVGRLMAGRNLPPALAAVAHQVRRANTGGATAFYPGSPLFALSTLGPQDTYLGCELRPDDHGALGKILRPFGVRATALRIDGYDEAARRLEKSRDRTLLVIDPPFERADDYARTADLVAARPHPLQQPALVWTPLKDLETFDAFLGRLEAAHPSKLDVLEVRLRALDDPMRLNGCAVVLVDAPDVREAALEAGRWVVRTLGDLGGDARWLDLARPAT